MKVEANKSMNRIAATLLLITLAVPAWGQDLEKGMRAYERGDYAAALAEWGPLAERGDANAQYNLGTIYDEGLGVPQNFGEANRWYRLAAEQGNAAAQYNLGTMYSYGKGVAQNFGEANRWFRLAAAQGLADAQYNLGHMYFHGKGVPQNFEQALSLAVL